MKVPRLFRRYCDSAGGDGYAGRPVRYRSSPVCRYIDPTSVFPRHTLPPLHEGARILDDNIRPYNTLFYRQPGSSSNSKCPILVQPVVRVAVIARIGGLPSGWQARKAYGDSFVTARLVVLLVARGLRILPYFAGIFRAMLCILLV
jgi:hypothetical protein